jgi:hypothetical protein
MSHESYPVCVAWHARLWCFHAEWLYLHRPVLFVFARSLRPMQLLNATVSEMGFAKIWTLAHKYRIDTNTKSVLEHKDFLEMVWIQILAHFSLDGPIATNDMS